MSVEENKINIIFLDVDGVLNNDGTVERTKTGFTFVEDRLLKRLKHIVDATNAKIVLSSDWRFDRFMDDPSDYLALKEVLEKNGTPIYAHTGDYMIKRGSEIIKWMKNWHGEPINNFVILDDMPAIEFNFTQLLGHFVHTNEKVGLTHDDAAEAIAILKNADLFLS